MKKQNFLQFFDGKESIVEFGSVNNNEKDEMYIKCFLTTEGVNKNNFKFTRKVLLESFTTFIGKPVVIVPDENNLPTGHGYDNRSKKFDDKKRKIIGIIYDVELVIVRDGVILHLHDFPTQEDFMNAKGEMRIIGHLNVWKFYFPQIAEKLDLLNYFENLCFSMEAVTNVKEVDGVKVCTEATFQGVAIVQKPAFEKSKAIMVCENDTKEEEELELEQALAELEQVKQENVELASAKDNLSNEVNSLKEVNSSLTNQVTTLSEELTSLQEYRTKYEALQKEKLGQERMSKLNKVGSHEYTCETLAEKTDVEFAEIVIALADAIKQPQQVVSPIVETHNAASHVDTLKKILGGDK